MLLSLGILIIWKNPGLPGIGGSASNTRYINNETKFRNHSTVDPQPHPGNHIIDFLNRHNSCHRIITAFLLSYNLVFRYKEKINNRLILNALILLHWNGVLRTEVFGTRSRKSKISVNEVPREWKSLVTKEWCFAPKNNDVLIILNQAWGTSLSRNPTNPHSIGMLLNKSKKGGFHSRSAICFLS